MWEVVKDGEAVMDGEGVKEGDGVAVGVTLQDHAATVIPTMAASFDVRIRITAAIARSRRPPTRRRR